MDKTRHKLLIESLKRVNRQIDRFYRKWDVVYGDACLLGVAVDKPKELIILERRQKTIFEALQDNFDRSADLMGFESVGEIVESVKEGLF